MSVQSTTFTHNPSAKTQKENSSINTKKGKKTLPVTISEFNLLGSFPDRVWINPRLAVSYIRIFK